MPMTVRYGNIGKTVKYLQELLNKHLAAEQQLIPDSKFGKATRAAVNHYQSIPSHGLAPPDGVVGPKTWKVLEGGITRVNSTSPQPSIDVNTTAELSATDYFKVPPSYAGKSEFRGKLLGYGKYKGECAAGVQAVFWKAGIRSLGKTRTWNRGVRVCDHPEILAGAAIASFKYGAKKYQNTHAAIFIQKTFENGKEYGLEVWDQFNNTGSRNGHPNPPQVWHKRVLRINRDNETDSSNNGYLFYTLRK